MNQMQSFLLALALLAVAIVLYIIEQPSAGGIALGAVIGVLVPSDVRTGNGGA